jgi:hypothetical protein
VAIGGIVQVRQISCSGKKEEKLKVAFKPFGGNKTASTRLRVVLPIRHINKRSREVTCEIFNAKKIYEYSLVIFQKTYSNEDLATAELLKKQGVKIAFDLCDNHFYNPTKSTEAEDRIDRLRKMIDLADAISVSNKGLGELTDRPYTVIDDMLEFSIHGKFARKIFKPFFNIVKDDIVRLVWFGAAGSESPRFGMIDIERVIPELNELSHHLKIQLSIISNSKEKYKKYLASARFLTKYYEWNGLTFPYIMQKHDISLIPIDQNPFTIYKTNNRAVLSLLLGLPVVADRIPSYEVLSDFIRFGDWKRNIETYSKNVSLKEKDVSLGKNFIMETYNANVVSDQWINFIKTI